MGITLYTYQTVLPPAELAPIRELAKNISKSLRKYPDSCYLHIKDWQRYRGMTSPEAAKRIGVSAMSYRNWADNRHWPNSFHLAAMAETFGCSIEELYFPPPGMRK